MLVNSVFTVSCYCCFLVGDIVQSINQSLENGTPEETHSLLQKPEGMFPKVLPRSAFLYHDGLFKAKQVRFISVSDTCILGKKFRVLPTGVEPMTSRVLVQMLYH